MADDLQDGTGQSARQFAHAVSQMAVTNILAKGAGFEYVQPSATSALVDVMAAYIQKIGRDAQELAEVAGRAKPRGTDVSLALKDMVPYPVGLDDMIKAFQESQHRYEGKLAFPREVPKFPAPSKKRKADDDPIEEIGQRDSDKPAYTPSFAPPLPFKHSYSQQSHVVVSKEVDPKRIRLDLLHQKSEVQASLHNLADHVVAAPTALVDPVWKPHVSRLDLANPYLAPPRVESAARQSNPLTIYAAPTPSYRPVVAKPTKRAIEIMSGSDSLTNDNSNANNQKVKEDKILAGTYHEGDSD
ncbi:hypothetical protein H257_01588 [Aphanomyces astaci]|uniref:Transcription initiation factor TFIID subunit 8 n=1 Tax=Aphanomyces astaci TaxID=112090 RepID=W4HB11_APHAT|nr:hypothetical protein H257_01588 [Aphanomyces astaci]ETV88303.1 hypothetical protein H257_01588 [Aphanomyces astaci]|eukprot:XP_009823166.1 hypothetical protein H257_01588 [Aphanomyces astaci]